MNRHRLIIVGLLALSLAAFVSLGVYSALRSQLAANKVQTTSVVAALTDLPVGARLEEKDLHLVRLPAQDLPSNVFHSVSELVGRGVIIPVEKNELILSNKVAAENAGAGLPAIIPPGMRAVSVKVNDVVAVGGFVTPGTRVDVLLTGNPERGSDPGKVSTTTVLQNIQVLAAGTKLQTNPDGEAEKVPVITLLVSPEDAQKLTLASSEGKIQLSLRNPLDTAQEKTPLLRNARLYGEVAAAPVARVHTPKAPAAPPPYVVEMIRGDKREVKQF